MTTREEALALAPLARRVERKINLKGFIEWLARTTNDPRAMIWAIYAGGKPCGYVVATAPHALCADAFIVEACMDAKHTTSDLRREMMGRIRTWAKAKGARGVQMETTRSAKAFERLFGFKPLSQILRLEF